MKVSVLLSLAAVALAFIEKAEAQLIFPPSLDECLATAGDQPSVDRCNAIQACVDNSSGSEQSLQNCMGSANAAHAAATNPTSGGEAPPQQGILNPLESDYYDIDGNKGWENTNQP